MFDPWNNAEKLETTRGKVYSGGVPVGSGQWTVEDEDEDKDGLLIAEGL